MDLAAVFLLSLLGGYFFALTWRVTAFSTQKADGHHLYFRAAGWGVLLFALALGLRLSLIHYVPSYASFDEALAGYVRPVLKEEAGLDKPDEARREQWVITATYSLFLGVIAAGLLNLVTPRRWALRRSVEGLDKLLLEAQEQALPVSFTLTSGKIYIGIIVDTPNPAREASVTTILPMFSGYRGSTGRMTLTTDYETLYESLAAGKAKELGLTGDWLSQFKLTFSADSISTASLFSPAVYAEFNPDWERQIAQPDKQEPQEVSVTLKRARAPAHTAITLKGTYSQRSSASSAPAGPPGEREIQRLNPQRVESILKLTGWPRLEPGSLNVELPNREALNRLLSLEPLWAEPGAAVKYPPAFARIPTERGPYLYYRAQLRIQNQSQPVLVRRPANPISDRIELFAPVPIAESAKLKPRDALEVTVVSSPPRS